MAEWTLCADREVYARVRDITKLGPRARACRRSPGPLRRRTPAPDLPLRRL